MGKKKDMSETKSRGMKVICLLPFTSEISIRTSQFAIVVTNIFKNVWSRKLNTQIPIA